jgi:hypothetical protein
MKAAELQAEVGHSIYSHLQKFFGLAWLDNPLSINGQVLPWM